nr:hypothetical protein [Tanacetum cinerariifolium]
MSSLFGKAKFFYDHTTKQALGFQNPFCLKKAQQLEPKLYDGNVIKNTCTIMIPDFKETLMLAEEIHSKMILKQQDPMVLEKKNSMNSSDPNLSRRPTKVEVSKELPKVSMKQGLIIAALRDELKKLKGKAIVDTTVTTHTIDPEMLKVDVEPIAPRLLNNKTVHSDYLRLTQEQAVIFREVVEQGKSQNPLNNSLDCAWIRPSTSASGSHPSSNTKKDKIQRPPSSTQKNKIEAHPRTVISSLKNKKYAVEPKVTATVQYSKLNANTKLICVECNGCMLSNNHDFCVPKVINDGMLMLNLNLLSKIQREKFGSQQERCSPILDTFGDLLVGPSL